MQEDNPYEKKDLRITKAVSVGVAERVALAIWNKFEIWDEKAEREFKAIMNVLTTAEEVDQLLAYLYAAKSNITNDSIKRREDEIKPF